MQCLLYNVLKYQHHTFVLCDVLKLVNQRSRRSLNGMQSGHRCRQTASLLSSCAQHGRPWLQVPALVGSQQNPTPTPVGGSPQQGILCILHALLVCWGVVHRSYAEHMQARQDITAQTGASKCAHVPCTERAERLMPDGQ